MLSTKLSHFISLGDNDILKHLKDSPKWLVFFGPILGSILVLAATEESLSQGILLLSFYSIGLAIPFILSGYLIQRFLIFSKNFRKNINLVSKIGGIILLITGILILTNQLQALGYYLLNIFPFLQNFG